MNDDTQPLPPIVRDYCRVCSWFTWGPAATHFRCMDCIWNATRCPKPTQHNPRQ